MIYYFLEAAEISQYRISNLLEVDRFLEHHNGQETRIYLDVDETIVTGDTDQFQIDTGLLHSKVLQYPKEFPIIQNYCRIFDNVKRIMREEELAVCSKNGQYKSYWINLKQTQAQVAKWQNLGIKVEFLTYNKLLNERSLIHYVGDQAAQNFRATVSKEMPPIINALHATMPKGDFIFGQKVPEKSIVLIDDDIGNLNHLVRAFMATDKKIIALQMVWAPITCWRMEHLDFSSYPSVYETLDHFDRILDYESVEPEAFVEAASDVQYTNPSDRNDEPPAVVARSDGDEVVQKSTLRTISDIDQENVTVIQEIGQENVVTSKSITPDINQSDVTPPRTTAVGINHAQHS